MRGFSGEGCVRPAIVSRKKADILFCVHHAPGRAAGDCCSIPLTKVRRAREGARRFVRLRGGARSFFSHVFTLSLACSVRRQGGVRL